MNISHTKKIIRVIVIFIVIFFRPACFAGFLDIPDITEVPTLTRESMLRDINIPNVRERDPDPESGPRLAVAQFRLQGIVEYPDLGITREEINKLIEDIRADLMEEYKLLESGYTKDELAEVSGMLIEIEKDIGERHVTQIEVQKLIWLIREQRSKRGITLGQIETIADRITRFYRERGFILAKAYIPKQEVRDGIVTLTLLLGILGEVNVEGQNLYSKDIISRVFDDALTKPITSSMVEENLYLINDFPGISVRGFFEPGAQVGDTRLNIKVNQEKRYTGNVRLDNHGTDQTGKIRLYADIFVNNTLGVADAFHVAILNSFSPDNATYAQIDYSLQVFSPRSRLSFLVARNQFVLGRGNVESINLLELSGSTDRADISYSYIFKRSRSNNHSIDLTVSDIASALESGRSGGFSGDFDDTVHNASITYNFDILQSEQRRLHQGFIRLTSGKFAKNLNALDEQADAFQFLNADYTLLTFWKAPFSDTETRLIFRTSLQFASSPLSSINQFAIAGPTRVKAYQVNKFSADTAFFTGLEWIFSGPDLLDFEVFGKANLKDSIQPFLFFDYSIGRQNKLSVLDKDEKGSLSDVGLGIKFSYLNNFKGNLQLAIPISSHFTSENVDTADESVQLVVDFQYNFL